jgi:hypothetical protein
MPIDFVNWSKVPRRHLQILNFRFMLTYSIYFLITFEIATITSMF